MVCPQQHDVGSGHCLLWLNAFAIGQGEQALGEKVSVTCTDKAFPEIKDIEAEMAKTQKNKATSYHLGQLEAKLTKVEAWAFDLSPKRDRFFYVNRNEFQSGDLWMICVC